MKKICLMGVVIAALVLVGAGCKKAAPEKPVVTSEVTNDGGTLHLSWSAVSGAESYEIKAGDSTYTTTSTSYDVTVPAATIEVWSVSGSTKSDSAATISCKIEESTVEIFGDWDKTHNNGFGFDEHGTATGYPLFADSFKYMDFYADTLSHPGQMRLFTMRPFNPTRKGDALKAASGSYDGATMADAPGTYADSSVAIMTDSTYYLRISADSTGVWSTGDNFVKARIDSIIGAKVILKTGYQKIGGLRWLVN